MQNIQALAELLKQCQNLISDLDQWVSQALELEGLHLEQSNTGQWKAGVANVET
jgi:hypothetical protein